MATTRNSSTPPASDLPPLHPFTLHTYLTAEQLAKLQELADRHNQIAARHMASSGVEYLQLTAEDMAAQLLAEALRRES